MLAPMTREELPVFCERSECGWTGTLAETGNAERALRTCPKCQTPVVLADSSVRIKEISPKTIERRIGIFSISPHTLMALLGQWGSRFMRPILLNLPLDAKVMEAQYSFQSGTFDLKVFHPSFAPVEPGEIIPRLGCIEVEMLPAPELNPGGFMACGLPYDVLKRDCGPSQLAKEPYCEICGQPATVDVCDFEETPPQNGSQTWKALRPPQYLCSVHSRSSRMIEHAEFHQIGQAPEEPEKPTPVTFREFL